MIDQGPSLREDKSAPWVEIRAELRVESACLLDSWRFGILLSSVHDSYSVAKLQSIPLPPHHALSPYGPQEMKSFPSCGTKIFQRQRDKQFSLAQSSLCLIPVQDLQQEIIFNCFGSWQITCAAPAQELCGFSNERHACQLILICLNYLSGWALLNLPAASTYRSGVPELKIF